MISKILNVVLALSFGPTFWAIFIMANAIAAKDLSLTLDCGATLFTSVIVMFVAASAKKLS